MKQISTYTCQVLMLLCQDDLWPIHSSSWMWEALCSLFHVHKGSEVIDRECSDWDVSANV